MQTREYARQRREQLKQTAQAEVTIDRIYTRRPHYCSVIAFCLREGLTAVVESRPLEPPKSRYLVRFKKGKKISLMAFREFDDARQWLKSKGVKTMHLYHDTSYEWLEEHRLK